MAESGRATHLAQRQFKTGDFAPNYRLTIDSDRISSKLFNCTVTYSADGTSDLAISADTDLEGYAGAKTILEIGYGNELWPYFGGWLEEPQNDPYGGPSSADAYGPFKELAELSLQDDITYAGQTLGAAIADLHRRAKLRGSTFEVVGNPAYLLTGEEAGLTISTTLADGINLLLDLAGWVSQDRPEFRRRYRAAPRPRPSGEVAASYTEAHYPAGGFRAIRGKPYGTVGAFARDDTTGALLWGNAPVLVRVAPEVSSLKTYWIGDFVGTQEQAYIECGKLAQLLAAGVYSWSLEGISANPELEIHDIIHVHTTELRHEGGRHAERYEVVYACAIDAEVTVDVSKEGHPMNLSGETAIKLHEKKLKNPLYMGHGASAVVRPFESLESLESLTFDEAMGLTFDDLVDYTFDEVS